VYAVENFKTKKALREAVEAGAAGGVWQPGPFGGDTTGYTGECSLEGPHYPQPHKWYARVRCEAGRIVQVLQ